MKLDAGLPTRRIRLLGLAVAAVALAGTGAVTVHGATLGGGLAEGRDPAPLIVSIGTPTPARWVPGQRHRISVFPRRSSVPAITAAAAPAAAAPTALNLAAEHAASYTFVAENAPGDPIRWDPCGTVHWVFNPAGAPAGGLTVLQAVVARVEKATGLHFAYDGTSTEVPSGTYLEGQTQATGFKPLLLGWSTPSASTLLANQPASLVGMDQTIWANQASGASHIVSGVVALNADVPAATSGANSWFTFALHELGHAVGLNHTTDTTQIMAATIPANATDYGSGDLAGLAKVGGTC